MKGTQYSVAARHQSARRAENQRWRRDRGRVRRRDAAVRQRSLPGPCGGYRREGPWRCWMTTRIG